MKMKTKELLKKYGQSLPSANITSGDMDEDEYVEAIRILKEGPKKNSDPNKYRFLNNLFKFNGSPKGEIPDYTRNGVRLVRDERAGIEDAHPRKVLALMLYPLVSGMGSERFYEAFGNIIRDVSRYIFPDFSEAERMPGFLEHFARQDVIAEMLDIGPINLEHFFVLDGEDLRIFDLSRSFRGYDRQGSRYKALLEKINPTVQAEEKDLVRRRIVRSQSKIFEILEALKSEERHKEGDDFPHFYKLFYGL